MQDVVCESHHNRITRRLYWSLLQALDEAQVSIWDCEPHNTYLYLTVHGYWRASLRSQVGRRERPQDQYDRYGRYLTHDDLKRPLLKTALGASNAHVD